MKPGAKARPLVTAVLVSGKGGSGFALRALRTAALRKSARGFADLATMVLGHDDSSSLHTSAKRRKKAESYGSTDGFLWFEHNANFCS